MVIDAVKDPHVFLGAQAATIVECLQLAKDRTSQAHHMPLFDQPLSDGHIKAILALFRWDASILPLGVHEDIVVDRH